MEEDRNPDETQRQLPGRPFSAENQPSGEAKSYGWWKKRKGKQMLKALMEMKFDGGQIPVDPNDYSKGSIPNPVLRQAAAYFNMPEEFITVEMIMAMKQVALAVQKNDTSAFNAVWDKAYGKPKEDEEAIKLPPPEIKFVPYGTEDGLPEILENEKEHPDSEFGEKKE